MSTTSLEEVACPECGVRQNVLVVESANIQRFPEFRARVLNGTFMRFTCVDCKASFLVETDLLYTDYEQRLFIGVFPRDRRAHVKECEAILEETYQRVFVKEAPAFARVAVGGDLQRRIVFGYEELREKIVCFSAGLDDHIVEAVKVTLITAQQEQPPLSLQGCDEEHLWFTRVGSPAPPFGVHRSLYQDLANDVQHVQQLLQPLWLGTHVSAEKCLAA